jgi:hypothetical protein
MTNEPASSPGEADDVPPVAGTIGSLLRNLTGSGSLASLVSQIQRPVAEPFIGPGVLDSIRHTQTLVGPGPSPLVTQGQRQLEVMKEVSESASRFRGSLETIPGQIAALATIAEAQLEESANLRGIVAAGQAKEERQDRRMARMTKATVWLAVAVVLETLVLAVLGVLPFLR